MRFFSSPLHASVFERDVMGGAEMFFHPGGGMATSTYLSAPPPEQYERALQGHRTRRTLCDVPVSVPNTDELYCSIPKIKVNRPKGPPAKKKHPTWLASAPGTSVPGVPRRPRPNQRCYIHL